MKRSYQIIGIAGLLLAFAFIFAACPPVEPPATGEPTPTPGGGASPTPFIGGGVLAAEAVEAGIQSLKTGEWDQALGSFSQAVALDPSNGEAQLWYSMLNIASIAVDNNLVTLVRDRLKFTDYPTTMKSLYLGDWFTMNVYMPGSPIPSFLPQIQVPQPIAEWEDGDASIITYNEYILAFMYNFVTANPNGFNDLVDGVVVDVLGPRLEAAVNWLHGMSDGFSVTFTWDMFAADETPPAVWPRDGEGHPIEVKIGKAELLVEAASLQSIRSLLTLFRSYNLTLPLATYYSALNPVDNPVFSPASFAGLASPLASGFLYGRPEAATILSQAKAAMQGALSDMLSAINGILSDRPGMFLSSGNPALTGIWEYITDILNYEKILCTKMQTSVDSNQLVIVPVPAPVIIEPIPPGSTPAPMLPMGEYFHTYSDAVNWPTDSNWGGPVSGPPTAIGINYGKIYTGTIFAIDSLFELQPAGENVGEPVWYKCTYTVNTPGDIPLMAISVDLNTAPAASINPLEDNVMYAFKIKDLTLGGLVDLDANFIDELRTLINGMTGVGNLGDVLLVGNPGEAISFYVPLVEPCFAYESFADADESLAVNYSYLPETFNYTTKGTFWWSIPELAMFTQTYILMAMAPSPPPEI